MNEKQLKELQEYNLEYLEAQASEEMYGGDYTSAVELKYANKKIERLNNIINELEKWLEDYIKLFDEPDMLEEQTCEDLKEVLDKLQELKRRR